MAQKESKAQRKARQARKARREREKQQQLDTAVPTSKKDGNRNPDGTFKVGNNANPTGKGGFQERPEDISRDGRPKNAESFVYWYRVFKDMSVEELRNWQKKNPESTRTVASDLAFTRMVNAKSDLKEFQEVADRSEGRSPHSVDVTSKGERVGESMADIALLLQKAYEDEEEEKPKGKPKDNKPDKASSKPDIQG